MPSKKSSISIDTILKMINESGVEAVIDLLAGALLPGPAGAAIGPLKDIILKLLGGIESGDIDVGRLRDASDLLRMLSALEDASNYKA